MGVLSRIEKTARYKNIKIYKRIWVIAPEGILRLTQREYPSSSLKYFNYINCAIQVEWGKGLKKCSVHRKAIY